MQRIPSAFTLIGLALCAGLCLACSSVSLDPGVSRELAESRKESIDSLRYDLFFSIPVQKDSLITAYEKISFYLDRPVEVVLDFRSADRAHLLSMSANGKDVSAKAGTEHIVVPRRALVQGWNTVEIGFIPEDQSLNRRDDYLYTLLVPDRARTLFPCFDQPDLKALYTLSLELPQSWTAVSNTLVSSESVRSGRKTVSFATTEPLSTYLFSFVAGVFSRKDYCGHHRIGAYYRETDPARLAQLDEIFRQVDASLDWLEEFTGIPYPFAKYDFVVMPGFQYGGMEHTGATLYNDNTLFLGPHPTVDEQLKRAELITHETSHMWFGDYVTMEWFNDVWTKEVFANYFAAQITAPLFPQINHDLVWLKSYVNSALSQDRTEGRTAIQQPLDNLCNAGLVYNQIIYNKAPVMLRKLVETMGWDAFRDGIREYLHRYAYGNADWDDLISILDSRCEDDLVAFSDVWVKEAGLPTIRFERYPDRIVAVQEDEKGRVWPQSFMCSLDGEEGSRLFEVDFGVGQSRVEIRLDAADRGCLRPSVDGRAYGIVVPSEEDLGQMLSDWHLCGDDLQKMSTLMMLRENLFCRRIEWAQWLSMVEKVLVEESDPLLVSTLVSSVDISLVELRQKSVAEARDAEIRLWNLRGLLKEESFRLQLERILFRVASTPEVLGQMRSMWAMRNDPLLSERDYTSLAYLLSLAFAQDAEEILAEQRRRLSNPDRLAQFDFVSRAVSPDPAVRSELFATLLTPEGRRIEPWASAALGYLCHPSCESVAYIRPGLDVLEEVQRTGDIFFPGNWCDALLQWQVSPSGRAEIESWLSDHSSLKPLLRAKVLEAAWLAEL